MAFCKFCDEEIEWEETDRGWRPLDVGTGERHRCERPPAQSNEMDKLREQVARLLVENSQLQMQVAMARASRPPQSSVWNELFLVEGAPPQLVQAAYKQLAQLYHPDKGGDAERMKRINRAYDTLKPRS